MDNDWQRKRQVIMNQHDAPRGTLATLGHPANEIYIVRTHSAWRYVDTGEFVRTENFRAGWDVLYVPEKEL